MSTVTFVHMLRVNYYCMTGSAFGSRVAVLARPQGESIQNLRTEIPPYCTTQKECNNNLFYDSTKSGQRVRGGKKEKKKKLSRPGLEPRILGRFAPQSEDLIAPPLKLERFVKTIMPTHYLYALYTLLCRMPLYY